MQFSWRSSDSRAHYPYRPGLLFGHNMLTSIHWVCSVLATVFLVEFAFYWVVFRWIWIPAANQPVDAQDYRNYGPGMHHRFVLDVFERVCQFNNDQTEAQALRTFLLSLFHERPRTPPIHNKKSTAINETERTNDETLSALGDTTEPMDQDSSDDDDGSAATTAADGQQEDEVQPRYWTIEELGKDDVEHLYAWAAFGKHLVDLSQAEKEDLDKIFTGGKQRFGLYFRPGSTHKYFAKQVGLENVQAKHRPLILYLLVLFVWIFAAFFLLIKGFYPFRSQSGQTGWFRPARGRTGTNPQQLPMVFFHGIAPAGVTGYIAFVLKGLAQDGRAVFLFENPAIAMSLFAGFSPLTQEETVQGVQEIVDRFVGSETDIAVVGHSFGTVPVTWLLHCDSMRNRIKQAVMLDPITILLTMCEVMNTFLYNPDSLAVQLMSPEIHMQNYLRRYFPFYNSDLDMRDVVQDCSVLVCLSERDDIVPAFNIRRAVELHLPERPNDKLIFWEDSQHGQCVVQEQKWNDIKAWMTQDESSIQNTKASASRDSWQPIIRVPIFGARAWNEREASL